MQDNNTETGMEVMDEEKLLGESTETYLASVLDNIVMKHTFHQLTWWSANYYELNGIYKTST